MLVPPDAALPDLTFLMQDFAYFTQIKSFAQKGRGAELPPLGGVKMFGEVLCSNDRLPVRKS